MVWWHQGLLLATWLHTLYHLSTAGFSCLSNPCSHGICIDDLNSSFTCYCIDGYTGVHCQTNWDECWSSPCLNGGQCHDGIASFNCSCPEGFLGEVCEQNVDECESNPCFNNGTCLDAANGYTCQCLPGYSGLFCEIDVAVCNSSEEMRCLNGGICIEGPGITFSCLCNSGWTGKLCQTQIDECLSSPCKNGAACVDLHADYKCACLFGYTGKDCDLELSMCVSNPCRNNALCLVEDDQNVCYCVPDYHGDLCQFQYDECQLGPGCKNGGTCIDGVDGYTCSCPPEMTGEYCECLILKDDELDCSYIRPTILTSTELPYTTFTTHPITQIEEVTLPFVQSTQVPKSITEIIETTSKTELITESETTEIITLTTLAESTEFSSVTEMQFNVSTVTEPITTSLTTDFVPLETTTLMEETKTSPEVTETASTTEQYSETTTFYNETITSGKTTEFESTTELTTVFYTTEKPDSVTTMFPIEISTIPVKELTTNNETEIATVTQELLTDLSSIFSEAEMPTTLTTETFPFPVESRTASSQEVATRPSVEEISSTPIIVTTKATVIDTTVSSNVTISVPPVFFDCTVTPCFNGGSCYFTKEGKKCTCKSGWSGDRCEKHTGIRDAAFTGHSYLTHRLANTSGTVVGISLRTLAPSGLLLYAQTAPHIYMSVYLQEGLLKFLFSCGIQTMLFSELHERVNTGYRINIIAIVELAASINKSQHCSASLRVNNTVVMSGEQRALTLTSINWSLHLPTLYLGGIPSHLLQNVDLPIKTGITGCMHGLQVDGKERNIYDKAVEGFEVSECSSLACLSSPCHSSATCVEFGEQWNCLCPSGYVGVTCESSVCINNPCQFGGTCTEYPGSGFICICPYGKHGLFCQNEWEIGQPLYTSSVHGISSFTAYPLQGVLHHSFEIRFRFIAYSLEQVALMLFIGQDHNHDATSDHLSVSFIKGFIVLTWNLGSGPRRIFTPQAVLGKTGRVHQVKLGRAGPKAWLQVDNLENITGTSPGRLTELNTKSILFIGGHKSVNFSGLPHDLPLHTGFSGCVYGVELKAGRFSISVGQVRSRVTGRGVGQCGTSHCHNTTCLNGGACLDHGATFTCLCRDGWFGPVCALRFNPCDTNRHNCTHGATCVPLESGYECDCSLGRAGKFCEKEELLSDVNFSGHRSYLSLPPAELHLHQTCLDFEIRPERDRGLVLFTEQPQTQSFLSLSLTGGILELRLQTLGGGRRRNGEVLIIRSGQLLSLASWHRVRAGRYGRRIYLWVDGTVNSGTLLQGEVLIPTDTPLYLGGIPDLSVLPNGAVAGLPVPFHGCMRRLSINWKETLLNEDHVLSARNVADCDGTACGGDVCLHNGSCWLDTRMKPHCTCTNEYTGDRCEYLVSCMEVACENGGHCVKEVGGKPQCHCPTGWEGPFCATEVSKGPPHFGGHSYLVVDSGSNQKKREGGTYPQMNTEVDFLYVNFSTVQSEGMILWTAQEKEFIGIGIENGLLKVVWSFFGTETSVATVPGIVMSDGGWHVVSLSFTAENITIWADHHTVQAYENIVHKTITTNGVLYLGGFPSDNIVGLETQGLFRLQFVGCVQELTWSDYATITDFTKFEGENIGSCQLFK